MTKVVPVYIRSGDGPEHLVARVTADPLASRESLAMFLRAVADEIWPDGVDAVRATPKEER